MATNTMGVRFTEEERHWINEYAAFTGRSVSEVIRESVMEAIEDAIDLYDYRLALAEDDGETASMDDVMQEVLDAQ